MKIINQYIDMISWTTADGKIQPLRFRYEENGSFVVVKILEIIKRNKNMFGGHLNYQYTCKAIKNSQEILFDLNYDTASCQWMLKCL